MRTGPVFEQTAWKVIPPLARNVLIALGPMDDDLILISWNGISGSLSVFYSPHVQRDWSFHAAKLAMIQEYLKAHSLDEDIPFNRINPDPGNSASDLKASPMVTVQDLA
jgi:hypothetical protein